MLLVLTSILMQFLSYRASRYAIILKKGDGSDMIRKQTICTI